MNWEVIEVMVIFLYSVNHKALDDLAGFLIEHNDTELKLAY